MYCYTISSFYSLLPASYICRSTLQPVSLSQSSKRITAATFRECFTVNRIVFYVVRENHVVNFGAYHKIYKINTFCVFFHYVFCKPCKIRLCISCLSKRSFRQLSNTKSKVEQFKALTRFENSAPSEQ